MHRKANLFQIFVSLLIAASLFPTTVQSTAASNPAPEWRPPAVPLVPSAAPVVDGIVDAAYGSPIASDPAGDGLGNANMDLLDLYAMQDEEYFYFAFTINADITQVNWGKYVLYIDTDGAPGSGADHDAWGRNVVVSDPHKPEFGIYSWVDAAPYGTDDVLFYAWKGSSWDHTGTISAAALSGGGTSAIEWKVAKADLEYPETIWVSVWNTGGGDSDNAQDTINNPADDWNAGDWSSQAVLQNSTQFGAPLVDGSIDQVYGDPLASDPADDGNGNAVMDLLDLYVTDDVDNFYFAFTINANIAETTWGKYSLYIDTDGEAGSGATFDAWTRNVAVNDPHKPEYGLYTWVDGEDSYGVGKIQFWKWSGSSWSDHTTISDAALTGGETSVIEWKIPKVDLGSPNTIWTEVWSTGGGSGDNAQDTINDPPDDWNASDWNTQAVLLNSTEYIAKVIKDGPPPAAGHDNNVWWDQLYHDSRDSLYRTPGGAVTTGTPVTLRLRAASGDLTEARVRVWDDRLDQQFFVPMQIVVDDGAYEYWEAVLPASSLPTVYWYRFIVIDGTDTDYYEDDNARTGGAGQPFDTSVDNSWQLTVYAADFATPEWIKNAVVYQVFVDRFHDGDSSNNTPPGTFFYNEAGGTVFRSLGTEWNTPVCDPRASGACAGTYSKNFYGGDLQGLLDKLDYLAELGITAIYLNPIFESPSNHKYDTTDFMKIDDNFGSLELFESLSAAASSRGMRLILDGVFNHSSSDSIYFDRYGRYPTLGACESHLSPYRDWYYFNDVTPGTGVCAGSTGLPNAANYVSWFGYDSLPKLQASSPEVRELIFADELESVGPYWMQWADGWRLDVAGDVDPGTINDPSNDFWEEFRTAVRSVNPEAYIVGEEWGNATSWTIGGEWDATMNYPLGTAVMGFWRDLPFMDNDHNAGSSAGTIAPLTPAELDERLRSLEERYPPEAFYAMLNLLGSHDTNRALFMLDHNAALGTDNTLLWNPNYDWSDSIERLKGVALLQLTLPGAPTIYYGDEVGLVGPPTFANGSWEDDPYNRQPYPWLEQGLGTPFYTHLQTQAGQDVLRDHYTLLAQTRNSHPALRTGSFDTLLMDNVNRIYSYGRLMADYSDAAVVIANRGSARTVTLDVSGYLPIGAIFVDVLNANAPSMVEADGTLTVSVPAASGVLLVLQSALSAPPDAPVISAVEGSEQVTLSWDAVPGAVEYQVYRSRFQGGGYEQVGATPTLTFVDMGLTNGLKYYYVVIARSGTTGLESAPSNEVSAIPHYSIGWANLQWPPVINHTIGINPTPNIYGQVWIADVTSAPGPTPGLLAQLGYGPEDTDPRTWTDWVEAEFNIDAGNNDEFVASLLPEATGSFWYVYRYSTTAGRDWLYADLGGPFTTTLPSQPGLLMVLPSADMTPPSTPLNLEVVDWGADFIELSWEAATDDEGVYAYDVYRSPAPAEMGEVIARVYAPDTSYTDRSMNSGVPYYYRVRAIDTSFNFSEFSNAAEGTAEPKMVAVTFRVRVPDYTPSVVYIAGAFPAGFEQWNPSAYPMTKVSDEPDIWERTFDLPDGLDLQYKFARGDWSKVEAWGSITGLSNRRVLISYGTDGTQLVDNTATDWGTGPDDEKAVQLWVDPLVTGTLPAAGAVDVPVTTTIRVTWSKAMAPGTDFVVNGPTGVVGGSFSYDSDTDTVIFTPSAPLAHNAVYTVLVSGETSADNAGQQEPHQFTFTTAKADEEEPPIPTGARIYLPLMHKP